MAPRSRGQPRPRPDSPVTAAPPPAGFQQIYLEPLLKFHVSLKKLHLHEAEYVLLQAMLLFSPGRDRGGRGGASPRPCRQPPAHPAPPDRASITQRDFIDQFQEKVALTLKSYIDCRHPMPESRYVPRRLAQPRSPPPWGQPPGPSQALPPRPRFLYAKLLLLLTELQTLKVENTRQILHIQDLSSMTPLLSEIIS